MRIPIRWKLVGTTCLIAALVGFTASVATVYQVQQDVERIFENQAKSVTQISSQLLGARIAELPSGCMGIQPGNSGAYGIDVNYGCALSVKDVERLGDSGFGPGKVAAVDDWSVQYNNQVIEITGPVSRRDGSLLGYMKFGILLDQIQGIKQQIWWRNLLVTLGCFAIGGGLSWWIAGRMSRPISDAVEAAGEIGRGKLGTRFLQGSTQDEVGLLMDSLNDMAQQLDETTVSKDYVNYILNSMGEALLVLDTEGRVQMVNRVACDLLKSDEGDLVGESIQKYFLHEEPLFLEQGMRLIESSGVVSNMEKEFLAKDGSKTPILVNCAALTDSSGTITGVIFVAIDLTERRKTEQELLEAFKEKTIAQTAAKAKGDFLAKMTHELRTPLNAIIGYSEIVGEEAEAEGLLHIYDDIQKIHHAGNHLLSLINDVLDLSKVEAGKMEVYVEPVDVADVANQVADIIRPMAEKQGNRLVLDVDKSIGEMQSDSSKIRQILINLMSNASKFCHQGEIRLTVEPCQHQGQDAVRFQVKDDGIGMTPEQMEKIFADFVQADSSTTRKYGGTGLGLAITKHLCDLLRGRIDVDSRIDQWTAFTVILPNCNAAAQAKAS